MRTNIKCLGTPVRPIFSGRGGSEILQRSEFHPLLPGYWPFDLPLAFAPAPSLQMNCLPRGVFVCDGSGFGVRVLSILFYLFFHGRTGALNHTRSFLSV